MVADFFNVTIRAIPRPGSSKLNVPAHRAVHAGARHGAALLEHKWIRESL